MVQKKQNVIENNKLEKLINLLIETNINLINAINESNDLRKIELKNESKKIKVMHKKLLIENKLK